MSDIKQNPSGFLAYCIAVAKLRDWRPKTMEEVIQKELTRDTLHELHIKKKKPPHIDHLKKRLKERAKTFI